MSSLTRSRKQKTMTLPTTTIKGLLRDRAAAKAERDLLLDAFGPSGSPSDKELMHQVASTFAALYDAAHPLSAVRADDAPPPSSRKRDAYPSPGADTRRERNRLMRGRRRLEEWVREFAGEQPDSAGRPEFPKCETCNRRGRLGERFCGRCGGSFDKEDAA